MQQQCWCEHLDKISKYTLVKYDVQYRQIILRVQSWFCPECGVHGAQTEIMDTQAKCDATAAG